MIIVNTKNRNMPHPLHNLKFKGKMKYFTESLYKKVLPSLLCLLIANLFVVEAIKGQCTFRPLLTDSIKVEVSPSADNRVLTFSDLALILGQECPPGPTTHLWMTYPVMGGTSLPVYLGNGSNTRRRWCK